MNTRSPTECPSWAKLAQHAESWRSVHLRELFAADATRERLFAAEAPGVRYDYSRQRLGAMTLRRSPTSQGSEDSPSGAWRCFPAAR